MDLSPNAGSTPARTFPPPAGPRYEVRLARDGKDVEAAQRLRFEVFNRELRLGLAGSYASRCDRDVHDAYCDHLLVVDPGEGRAVGTYRLLAPSRVPSFGYYSESEFHMENLRRSGLSLLELGRSCVHPDHRTGRVLGLLFRGISEYAERCGADALVGCASLHGHDPAYLRALCAVLRRGRTTGPELRALPRRGFEVPGLHEDPPSLDEAAVLRELPPLFRGYLSMGAKVCGDPAWDRQFGTTDFLVLLDRRDLELRYRRRYATEGNA